jgi:hypothetical protein
MKRQKFIGSICPILLASMMASPMLVSCSKEEEPTVPLSEEEKAYLETLEKINEDGYFTEGKKLHILLTHERYKELDTIASFVNDMENGLLAAKKNRRTLVSL